MRLLFSRLQSWFSMLRSDPVGFIVYLLYLVVTVLLSLILHEIAHGYVAYRCGDPTARMLGRVTLNPIKHVDAVGFAMLFELGSAEASGSAGYDLHVCLWHWLGQARAG